MSGPAKPKGVSTSTDSEQKEVSRRGANSKIANYHPGKKKSLLRGKEPSASTIESKKSKLGAWSWGEKRRKPQRNLQKKTISLTTKNFARGEGSDYSRPSGEEKEITYETAVVARGQYGSTTKNMLKPEIENSASSRRGISVHCPGRDQGLQREEQKIF